jgi:tripartite-type tricarboxylate transporter receptor subunit TctC
MGADHQSIGGASRLMWGVLRIFPRPMALAAALVAATCAVRAQDYPSRPVRVIVQTAAGSSLDALARIVTEQLAQIWGKEVIIVNQAGAGGLNAARATADAAPDGSTLFLAGGSVFVALPVLHNDLPFDVNQFEPIGFIAEQPYAILVSSKLDAVHSLAELIAYSKTQPSGLDAVAGTLGGLQHLTAERFRQESGAKLNMIHYPGTEAALGDVISGRVPVMFQTILPVAGVVASGAVRMLAVASSSRLPDYPEIPTASETVPGFTSSGWSILVAPHGTPPAIVQKVNADLRTALSRPEVLAKFKASGNYSRPMSPQELTDFVNNERGVWRPIVQQVGAAAQ